MATIRERFLALGLPLSRPVLSKFGQHVSTIYRNENRPDERTIIEQLEDGEILMVYNYPNEWTDRMDKVILSYLRTAANG